MKSEATPRLLFLAIFAVCAGLIGYGLFLQHVKGLEPCPLCILQRYAFIVCGLIALAAAIHNPASLGRRVYAGLLLLPALFGGGVAARQSWIQHFPPPPSVSCGPDMEFMLDAFPLTEALPMIFKGTGDCAKVDWTFLWLSIAEWALVWFVLFALAAIFILRYREATPGPHFRP